jgi:rubrerythrin
MAKTGSIFDILRVGIARETEANVFYNLLSQYVNNPEIVQICKEFAAEELEHKANLELELFKLGETTAKNSKITSKPLDYMVDLSKIMNLNYPDLLILAMAKEKEAFRFYIELYSLTDKQEFREVLMEMAEEEARHKLRFEIQYDLYVSGKK